MSESSPIGKFESIKSGALKTNNINFYTFDSAIELAVRSAIIEMSASRLVETTPRDVSHPLDCVMVTIIQLGFKHLQIPHLEP